MSTTGSRRCDPTREDGSYALSVWIRAIIGSRSAPRDTISTLRSSRCRSEKTADLDIAVTDSAATVQQVVIVGNTIVEKKNVGKSEPFITQRQIRALPQVTRNFLSFADLRRASASRRPPTAATKLQGGAQATTGVNVYIDGVGQKNYVLQAA